jgi:hypothetical protein
MLNQSDIVLGTTVTFDLYPFALFGTTIKNAKVLSLLDGQTAQQLGYDPRSLHVQVYPTLPPGTPDGFDKYFYLQVLLPSGQRAVYGLPWIKSETYKTEVMRDIMIRLNGVTPDKENQIRRALANIDQPITSLDVV